MPRKSAGDGTLLRKKAEQKLDPASASLEDISADNAKRLIHELQVHQIELEMQNEELRNVRGRLEESAARYADLYDFAPVGYATFDKNGLILEANLAAATRLGIARSRLVGKPLSIFVLEADRDAFHVYVKRALGSRERQTCEVRLRAKGGTEFYARLESICVEDTNGKGLCRTSIIDISRSKIAEEALQRAYDVLEKQVEERTAELAESNENLKQEIVVRKHAEEELLAAKAELEVRVRERTQELSEANSGLKAYSRKLEFMNNELQEFAHIASHDLQEPLRKIQTFSTMVVSKCLQGLDEASSDYLRRVQGAASRMQQLLQALLRYSHVATNPDPFKECNLADAIRDVVGDLSLLIHRTGGKVESSALPVIQADTVQIRQLFQNLISNALKFHRDDVPPVVKVYALSGETGTCSIAVEDNGIGFEEQYAKKIFAPFQRLHGRDSRYDGTGMGLAICRKIVERHGGNITAKSEEGKGSIFIITLPVSHRGGGEGSSKNPPHADTPGA